MPYRTLGMNYYGAFTLRWALAVGRRTRWFEHRVERLPERGFRVRIRNTLPWAEPSLSLQGRHVGLEPAYRPALWFRLKEPAFRKLAELEVVKDQDVLRVRVSHRMKLRLYYLALRSDWQDAEALVMTYRPPDGAAERLADGVGFSGDFVEWEAAPGEYELKTRP